MIKIQAKGEISGGLLFVIMAVAVGLAVYVVVKVLPWNAKKREVSIEEPVPVSAAPTAPVPKYKQGFGGNR